MAKKKGKKESKKRVKKENIIGKTRRYFKEVKYEVTKVTWPNRNEIINSTIVVVVVVLFFTFYIGVLDVIFVQLVKIFTYKIGS
ncbi:MAG: preprotein translocase subunit SecE [Actinomycetia bacterium]|nr:preprotein translocase subunit SecE [Actinomycetes bacterium]